MKKRFKMTGLDCANCAAKMEAKISKLPGVKSVSISFMTQRMIIEADADDFDEIIREADRVVKLIEPDCIIEM